MDAMDSLVDMLDQVQLTPQGKSSFLASVPE